MLTMNKTVQHQLLELLVLHMLAYLRLFLLVFLHFGVRFTVEQIKQ
jgi:hypothetical protein